MEFDLIRQLLSRIAVDRRLVVGPGDDAAVWRPPAGADVVATSDMLMDGVDFRLDEIAASQAGYKSLAVNLSDLAAMAAEPAIALVSLCLPRRGGRELALALYDGLLPLADSFGVAVAGGDVNSWEGPLVVSVALLGTTTPRGPLTRSGGQPGDRLLVTGNLGGSLAGRHLDFVPRVREALFLNGNYTLGAGIDISDGLAQDLAHLAAASGCGAVVDAGSIPLSPAAHELARRDGRTPLEHAMEDGEDFELVLAVSPDEAQRMLDDQPLEVPLTEIGQLVPQPGLWQRTAAGELTPLAIRGWSHPLD